MATDLSASEHFVAPWRAMLRWRSAPRDIMWSNSCMFPLAATMLRTFSERSIRSHGERRESVRVSSVRLMSAPWSSSQSRTSGLSAKSLGLTS